MDDSEGMMKIMIATDNHIGYMEKDVERRNDSLESFEEILRIAKEREVDFILLGGDLFHDNNPSRLVLHKTMELFRHYCMGSRPCSVELRSDPSVNFQHSKFPVVNYEDPNYNISIPVFMIHGNHDDPTGDGNLSAVDILDVSNFINYFGKATDIENIEISPVLLQKGSARLALYGLGSCRDERLHRMFRKGKVRFSVPTAEEGEWFNLLVLHQNRAKHGATNYIPVNFIPDFFDLVFWAHEHECLIEPQFVPTGGEAEDGGVKGVYITQPGSSVATSLCNGEQPQKHVGILYIKDDQTFKIEPIPLQTVRPFVIETVSLKDTGIHHEDDPGLEKYLIERVTDLVDKAAAENRGNDKLPLVRLRVDYNGGYTPFNWARFSERFQGKLANPKNILQWFRQREQTTLDAKKKEEKTNGDVFESLDDVAVLEQLDVSSLVEEELKKENLCLLSEKNMVDALGEFVDHQENEAIQDCVKFSLQKCQEFLRTQPSLSDKDVDKQIDEHRGHLSKLQETEGAEAFKENLSMRRQKRLEGEDEFGDKPESEPDSDESSSRVKEKPKAATTTRGRGAGRGRGRGSRGGGGGRGSKGGGGSGRGSRGGGGSGRGSRGGGASGRGSTHGSRGSKSKDSRESIPSASYVGAPSPGLSFSSSGASKESRVTGKRAFTYIDDDSEEEQVSFSTARNPKKKSKSADLSFSQDNMVDLTQDDDDDDDSFMETSSSHIAAASPVPPTSKRSNPFSFGSAKATSRRKKS